MGYRPFLIADRCRSKQNPHTERERERMKQEVRKEPSKSVLRARTLWNSSDASITSVCILIQRSACFSWLLGNVVSLVASNSIFAVLSIRTFWKEKEYSKREVLEYSKTFQKRSLRISHNRMFSKREVFESADDSFCHGEWYLWPNGWSALNLGGNLGSNRGLNLDPKKTQKWVTAHF